ncbi:MAG: fasciclin domain-containing protein [Prevotella sp.]
MTKRELFRSRCRQWLATGAMLLGGFLAVCSCSEDYDLDEKSPDWLGASIYEYLAGQGNYTNLVRMIDDLGEHDVLAKTGSRTLFAANDEAFERFYRNNEWGVRNYESLTKAQKTFLLHGSMITMSYQVNNLASTEGTNGEPTKGDCMRRLTALEMLDTVPVLKTKDMPDNPYWKRYREKGSIVCFTDYSQVPLLHFIEAQLNNKKITNDDYNFIYNYTTSRQVGDASVNGVKIVEQNIKCMNGFVHRMEDVIMPLKNMAEIIASKPQASLFNNLMERFCAPYECGYTVTNEYNGIYGTQVDTVFQKRFFSEKSQGGTGINETPDHEAVPGRLKYDPGWNSYYSGQAIATSEAVALQKDMGVIMVPSDAAMNEYWENGAGRVLKDYYGTWENVPDNVIAELLNNNMLTSFVGSVPSKFNSILNDANDPMGISKEDIDSVWLGCNGAVYLTNKVYSPTAYVSVSFPALINETMNVLYWGIKRLQYNVYLNSLNSYYSFFIPTNNALLEYIDPVSYGKAQTQIYRFHYDATRKEENDKVWASIWNYDPVTKTLGDSIGLANYYQIIDRLGDILDNHIVIGNVEDGNEYYRTKGGAEIRVKNVAAGAAGMTVEGSYQVNEGSPVNVSYIYDQSVQGNGKSYILESEPIMGTRKTVYNHLAEHEEYSEFLSLLQGCGLLETIHDKKNACGGTNISTFNTYHYTIYVPTNESVRKLLDTGKLPTWEQVEMEREAGQYNKVTADSAKIVDFVKYHIQDNALFIGAGSTSGDFETAVIDPSTERFYRLTVSADNSGITINDVAGNTRHVLTNDKNLYNLMAKEWQYNSQDASLAGEIETSSSAVIHLIDGPLMLK